MLESKTPLIGVTFSRLLPGTRTPCRGLESAIPISVIPYLSSKVCPVMAFHFFRTGTGRAAEPDTINLHVENHIRKHLRSFHSNKMLCKACMYVKPYKTQKPSASIQDIPHAEEILCLIGGSKLRQDGLLKEILQHKQQHL